MTKHLPWGSEIEALLRSAPILREDGLLLSARLCSLPNSPEQTPENLQILLVRCEVEDSDEADLVAGLESPSRTTNLAGQRLFRSPKLTNHY
jgi:hypothetical protein